MNQLAPPGDLGTLLFYVLFWYAAALLVVIVAAALIVLMVYGSMIWAVPRERRGVGP